MKGRQITALFTLLALLIAPLCAPFCHSRVCAASSAAEQYDDCHNPSAASGETLQFSLTAVHNCGSQELPTAALSKTTSSPEFVKLESAPQTALNFVPPTSVPLGANAAESPHPDIESRIQSVSAGSSVLRI